MKQMRPLPPSSLASLNPDWFTTLLCWYWLPHVDLANKQVSICQHSTARQRVMQQFCSFIYSSACLSRTSHMLCGSVSTVLMAQQLASSMGNDKFWPLQNRHPSTDHQKIVTGDYVGDSYSCAKYGANPSMVASATATTTILWPFVRNYPGEPVPEETFTDSHLSWS